jgi:hypothetical protein
MTGNSELCVSKTRSIGHVNMTSRAQGVGIGRCQPTHFDSLSPTLIPHVITVVAHIGKGAHGAIVTYSKLSHCPTLEYRNRAPCGIRIYTPRASLSPFPTSPYSLLAAHAQAQPHKPFLLFTMKIFVVKTKTTNQTNETVGLSMAQHRQFDSHRLRWTLLDIRVSQIFDTVPASISPLNTPRHIRAVSFQCSSSHYPMSVHVGAHHFRAQIPAGSTFPYFNRLLRDC